MKWIEAFLLMLALVLAGADDAWFPWVNLLGLVIFFVFTGMVKRSDRKGADEVLQANCRRQNVLQGP
ncbi:MAG: hypothetical protein IH614_17115 [Desulfuromonadales bacterium]|nr:hypothetical protein [Desulfuromonadales bacterium]